MCSFLSRSAVCLTVLTVVPASLGDVPPGAAHWTWPASPSLVYSSVPPGYWQAGGAEGRVGSPYYYRPSGRFDGYVAGSHWHGGWEDGSWNGGSWHGGGWHGGAGHGRGWHGGGGYDGGRPTPSGGWAAGHGYSGAAYMHHFGPGFYRHSERGHYRFPNYSYRRPWYFQGPPTFNRDTNFAW